MSFIERRSLLGNDVLHTEVVEVGDIFGRSTGLRCRELECSRSSEDLQDLDEVGLVTEPATNEILDKVGFIPCVCHATIEVLVMSAKCRARSAFGNELAVAKPNLQMGKADVCPCIANPTFLGLGFRVLGIILPKPTFFRGSLQIS